jgi:hypothetical protein
MPARKPVFKSLSHALQLYLSFSFFLKQRTRYFLKESETHQVGLLPKKAPLT